MFGKHYAVHGPGHCVPWPRVMAVLIPALMAKTGEVRRLRYLSREMLNLMNLPSSFEDYFPGRFAIARVARFAHVESSTAGLAKSGFGG